MTRKPNFWKCILGVGVLALLFVGAWATPSARLTTAEMATPSTRMATSANAKSTLPLAPLSPAPGDDLISSVFEVDGDIFDSPAGGPDDWSAVNCDTGSSEFKTFLNDGLGTTIFTQGGSKDPNDISVLDQQDELKPGWKHTNGSVPDKDEILNAYAALYHGSPNGDTIVAFGADRFSSSGDAFFGAWFFQKSVYAAADGTFREQVGDDPAASDPLATHVIGDVLVLINFTGGGGTATGQVLEWVPVGTPCPAGSTPIGQAASKTLCDITGTAPVGSVLGTSNDLTGDQDIPDDCDPQTGQTESWNDLYTPKSGSPGVIPTAHFFEGAINLSAFPALRETCFSSFLIETRSSSSPSAQLKDFVLGSFDTCPEVSITKTADDTSVCAGTPTTYTYTVTNPTPLSLTGTVVDDNETPADPSDDLDVTNNCAAIGMGSPQTVSLPPGNTVYMCTRTLSPGSHTNVATVTASFGSFSTSATDDETVTVSANPDMSIDNFACNTTGFASTLTATDANASGATLSWTRNGVAFAGNVASIDVTLPGVYEVTATTTGGCSDTAARTVGICTTCSP